MATKSLYKKENAALVALLRQTRDEAGLTQVELAEALGRPQSFVSKVERGERRLDLLQLRELCQACGVSLAAFVKRFEAALHHH
jgi:transcriptional regulator with XRE-family HTH domain